MNHTFIMRMKIKQSFVLMSVLLVSPLLMLPLQSSADDSVTIMNPAQSATPQLVLSGLPVLLTISGEQGATPHDVQRITVRLPTGSATSPGGCPITLTEGHELRHDDDGDGDYTDGGGGSSTVMAFIPDDMSEVKFPYGRGGNVQIVLIGSATITPFLIDPAETLNGVDDDGDGLIDEPHPGRYAWQDVNLSGPGTFGTDNTIAVGAYQLSTCGDETDDEVPFFGDTDFIVLGCSQAEDQPDDPIDMNTVIGKSNGQFIAKTIHAEKIVFNCAIDQGSIPVIADVTIIAEIFENMDTQQIIKKQAMIITCLKEPETVIVVSCTSDVPTDSTPVVNNCSEEPVPHPQEMNTVTKGKIVKTINAQKEIFLCKLGPEGDVWKKVDVVLFTEIWEDVSRLPLNPIIKITVESMRCVIDLSTETPTLESCDFKTIKTT